MDKHPRRKRRLLQFSLRTFLVLLTVVCIWLGIKSQSVHKQREVAGLVQRLGGRLAYDYQYHDDPFSIVAPKPPPGPALLRSLVGDDFFADLVEVEIDNVQDGEVRRLAEQTTIRHLVVSGMLSDRSIESISHLINLERLEIHGGRYSGAGFSELSKLTKLRSLTISDTALSDDAAANIGRLVTIEELSLTNTRLASRQLRHFKDLQKLSTLDLSGNLVGDKGLEVLQEMKGLTDIRLQRSMVTAKGIKKLHEAFPHAQITPMVGQELD